MYWSPNPTLNCLFRSITQDLTQVKCHLLKRYIRWNKLRKIISIKLHIQRLRWNFKLGLQCNSMRSFLKLWTDVLRQEEAAPDQSQVPTCFNGSPHPHIFLTLFLLVGFYALARASINTTPSSVLFAYQTTQFSLESNWAQVNEINPSFTFPNG